MKTRTEISITPYEQRIGYDSYILSLGSCFAQSMATWMLRAKFRVECNPLGVLFNPLSIADTLERFAACDTAADVVNTSERWHTFAAHTSLDGTSREAASATFATQVARGYRALCQADTVILTFGTAYIYEREGRVVANCHKRPHSEFTRRRLSVAEIVSRYERLIENTLHNKHVILTVSPVRHIGDGLQQNCVSKAILRLAAEELSEHYDNVDYFPSFEILCDDLRDYRYYADDMAHPSAVAIGYIREHFVRTALSAEAQQLLPQVERIVAAAEHRPFNPASDEYAHFCSRTIEQMTSLEAQGIDFAQEREKLKHLKI